MKVLIVAMLALFLTSGAVFAGTQTRAGGNGQSGTQTQTRTPGSCTR